MNLFFSSVAGQWAGVGRGFFLFDFASRKELQSDRLYSSRLFFSLFLLQNILIFPFFLILPLAWKYTNKMDVSLLFVFNVIIIIFLIRQVHPSFRRRRLRKACARSLCCSYGDESDDPQSKSLNCNQPSNSIDYNANVDNLPFFVSVSANSLIECE